MTKIARRAATEIDTANAQLSIEPIGSQIEDYFAKVQGIMDRRNAVVHAIWPAQPGEAQFGWRPGRLGDRGAVRVTQDNTEAGLTDLIKQAVALVDAWWTLSGLTTYARTRAAEPRPPRLP